ncbi:MAG: hypothetical protein U0Q19_20945 [Kineosporiaceae bacterium]
MSSLPPWGTPPDAHFTPPDAPTPHRASGVTYALLVEQQTGTGESMVWRVDPLPTLLAPGTGRAEADRAALDLAQRFQPHHPWNKGERTVFKLGEGSFLVLVEGATRTFHFRVSVAELIG